MNINKLGYLVNKENHLVGKYGYIYKKDSHNFGICAKHTMVRIILEKLGFLEGFKMDKLEEACAYICAYRNPRATPEEKVARETRIGNIIDSEGIKCFKRCIR